MAVRLMLPPALSTGTSCSSDHRGAMHKCWWACRSLLCQQVHSGLAQAQVPIQHQPCLVALTQGRRPEMRGVGDGIREEAQQESWLDTDYE
ncbi:hypothetical protein HaLaN_16970 [Haematococcus lacustris]|uniref:Uncharacterized protein n=1 Tax=Haematococcus lacustris TaxID=44745 RepID=A0A699ZLX0_HAELA|nr:hypothetical protein HaLaN_16970 [Haematococcus lacustris]